MQAASQRVSARCRTRAASSSFHLLSQRGVGEGAGPLEAGAVVLVVGDDVESAGRAGLLSRRAEDQSSSRNTQGAEGVDAVGTTDSFVIGLSEFHRMAFLE